MKLRSVFSIITMVSIVTLIGCNKKEDVGMRPTVTSTDPINKATGTSLSTKIMVTFSVPMDPASMTSGTVTLQNGSTSITGTVVSTGTSVSITPSASLTPNTVYTATITTGAKNMAGTSMAKAYVWTFTTGSVPDTAAPTVTSTDPTNAATAVPTNHLVTITFSEAMNPTTVTSSTLIVKQGSTVKAGVVTYAGSIATFTPTTNFEGNKVYTVTITPGAMDLAGNAVAEAVTYSFTTAAAPDITLPTVTSTNPFNNTISVSRDKVIGVTFSEAMNPTTITSSTFTLKQGASTVAGSVVYSGTTGTYTPTNLLTASTLYTASISIGAKDLAGNALASGTTWSFTTGSASTGLAPVILGAAGNYLILAKTAINNSSTSALTGDLGLSPAAESYITGLSLTDATGFAISAQVTGKVYAADQADPTPSNLTTAVNNMLTAYTDAAGRPNPDFSELATGNIGGKTLASGLYNWSNTVTVPSNVTISGGANEVWIFQIAGDLSMSNAVHMTLVGGAQAKNIFWQVAGTVTIGTTAHFEGIILSQTGITLLTGASMNGRALAQTAVILDSNAMTKPQ